MMSAAEFRKDAMIETTALTKVFGNQQAVDHIDWTVPKDPFADCWDPMAQGDDATCPKIIGRKPWRGAAQ